MSSSGDRPERLLQRARGGDQEALNELLEMYRNYLQIMAQSQLGRDLRVRLAPSDIVQEALLDAFRGFTRFVGNSEKEFVCWLRKILVHNLADQAKHHHAGKRDIRRQQALEEVLDRSSLSAHRALATGWSSQSSPSKQAARRESAVILANALAGLPVDYREVITLRHLSGLEFREIAARMGRSPGAVRMLWARALERLHGELEGVL